MRIIILFLASVSFAQTTIGNCGPQDGESYHWEMESLISQLNRLMIDSQEFENQRAQLIEKHKESADLCAQNARAPASFSAEEKTESSENTPSAEEFEEIE